VQVSTNHAAAEQPLFVNGVEKSYLYTSSPAILSATSSITRIELPRSDVYIAGPGYFSFSESTFFLPAPYTTIPLSGGVRTDQVSYILSSYSAPEKLENGYYRATRTFSLDDAVPMNDRLSWMIAMPSLSEASTTVLIDDISVSYTQHSARSNDSL
jgi:hypothetical protein